MSTKIKDISQKVDNMIVLYTIDSNSIDNLIDISTNVLIFADNEENNIGKLYRGGGQGKGLQFIGSETANRLNTPVKIYGNDFDGSQDVSNNLTMTGILDNSTGEGVFDLYLIHI